MYLEFAAATRAEAEEAFFADGPQQEGEDGILRIALEGYSELELARLGQLCCGSYTPSLILDGDSPEDIITGMDPALTRHLAALGTGDEREQLARRWQDAIAPDNAAAARPERIAIALDTLVELAQRASALRGWVLYAQIIDEPEDDF